MSLFEIIGEHANPGSTGSVELGAPEPPRPSPGSTVLLGLVSLVLAIAPFVVVFWRVPFAWDLFGLTFSGLAVYLLVAHFVRPKADTSNLGWAGGIINNPFRISDDFNRFLLFAAIVLWPGRFVARGLLGLVGLARPREPRGWQPGGPGGPDTPA